MDPSIARDPAGNEAAARIKAALRARLLTLRAALPARADADARLAARLADYLARCAPACVGFYWPFQGEFDARATVTAWLEAGDLPGTARRAALPVVTDPRGPLAFHAWTPDCDMVTGRYGIAVPRDAHPVAPDLLLIPCVGFNRARYRLGYGGGFYDRTLAALSPRPRTVGIAFAATEAAELPVLPHDLPLDAILTESETI